MVMLSATVAYAWETDQLTARAAPLSDSEPYADALMQGFIDDAIRATNEATRCAASDDETHARFARELAQRVGHPTRVDGRGLLQGLGYDRVGAALEEGPVDRLTFEPDSDDIFARVGWWDDPIVDRAGICSTVELAGVRVGTDKIDHFLVNGYAAWERARQERDPVRYAVNTERTTLGWWTSRVFSYADLAADLAGERFYDGLMDGRRGADGCLVSGPAFRWSDWVTRDWDEVENPSVYRPAVQRAIDAWVDAHRQQVCAEYESWADPSYPTRLDAALERTVPRGLPRTDPFRLAERCG